MKYSIVIPSYNHCEDLLRPCLESIKKYTKMDDVEVIVVANGCTDDTEEYVKSLGEPFKLVWLDEASGFTKSTNEGLKVSQGDFIILLNNDTELLEQTTNRWIDLLVKPFEDEKVGMSGPLTLHDDYADIDTIIFFCAMIRKSVIDKIGLLDEIYSPGGGEDIDYSARVMNAGYTIKGAIPTTYNGVTNIGDFPIWHKDNQTFKDIPEYTKVIVKRNGLVNTKRYNKNIKLNLGAGGIEYKGYLSVDLYDQRANIIMDITKLDFEDNTITELLASHVFEHLNPYKCFDILKDWYRVLKPEGKLIMEMPNIEELCKRFVTASKSERYGILNAVYGSVNTTDKGDQSEITAPHLWGWYPEILYDHMAAAGFRNITFMPEQIKHPESNFRVEAIK